MSKKKLIGFGMFGLGMALLIVGAVFLAAKMREAEKLSDGEILVSAGEWALEGENGVLWQFTEVGKGKLTTDGHKNDYDFIWAIEGDKLKIETAWLEKLENEYSYTLDQDGKVLTLMEGNKKIELVAK